MEYVTKFGINLLLITINQSYWNIIFKGKIVKNEKYWEKNIVEEKIVKVFESVERSRELGEVVTSRT